VAESSFDAWIKYYRSDENTPNATVSYYAKGSLVALALDLSLRAAGGSLDQVMCKLWEKSGGGPIDEADIAQALQQVGGRTLDKELAAWVHGTEDLPLQPLLDRAGIAWQADSLDLAAELGLRVSEGALTGIHVKSVHRDSAAERAGINAGDELLAIDGWRVRRLEDARGWTRPGQVFALTLVRDQRLRTLQVTPPTVGPGGVQLKLVDKPAPAALALRREWLGT
jgi:predicted metalloprotease with PDZ domain